MISGAAYVCCAALALGARALAAQGAPMVSGGATIEAARVRDGALRLDGRLDEPEWQTAHVATGLTQSYPNPGSAATQRTEIRVLYTDRQLYVGVRAFDSHPDSIAAQLARRDATGIYSDWVHVVIDSYHDHRTGYRFSVNPKGVKQDAIDYDDLAENANWDAVWDVATSIDSLGWTAEFSIPFSQLRFASAGSRERVWGFQVQRDIARSNERDSWSAWSQKSPGFVSTFGELTALDDLPTPTRLELVPYASSAVTRAPGSAANPFFRRNATKPSAGADLRYGLPAGLTLTATVHPDFGQVEADPAVVNLTAFETTYPEKRPFFLEGMDAFRFASVRTENDYGSRPGLYSRRIGRHPQLSPSVSGLAYADVPNETSILGAAKITGKTRGWTIGLLDAVTDRETASYLANGVLGSSVVEPGTNYALSRLKHVSPDGNSLIGFLASATNRELSNDVLQSALRQSAYVGGIDFERDWARHAWVVSGYAAGTDVTGDRRAILATQRSSAHYFQRPDVTYLGLDSNATRLRGYSGELSLDKRGAWFGSVSYNVASPGVEFNDIGSESRADYRAISTSIGYQDYQAGHHLRSIITSLFTNTAWDFGGAKIFDGVGSSISATLPNLNTLHASASISPRHMSDQLTRGGPLAAIPIATGWSVGTSTDSRRRFVLALDGSGSEDRSGAHDRTISAQLDARPRSNVHVTLGPSLDLARSTNQFVRTIVDPTATSTYGRRFVFGEISQRTVSMVMRTDWTFTTALSLQLYAQPFVATGEYTRFKELARPSSDSYGTYGLDRGTITRDVNRNFTVDPDGDGSATPFTIVNPEFDTRSLHGDAVLRWEYRPGSTIFFVWQQQRSGGVTDPSFSVPHAVSGIFAAPPTNVFLVKASYWLTW